MGGREGCVGEVRVDRAVERWGDRGVDLVGIIRLAEEFGEGGGGCQGGERC